MTTLGPSLNPNDNKILIFFSPYQNYIVLYTNLKPKKKKKNPTLYTSHFNHLILFFSSLISMVMPLSVSLLFDYGDSHTLTSIVPLTHRPPQSLQIFLLPLASTCWPPHASLPTTRSLFFFFFLFFFLIWFWIDRYWKLYNTMW